MMFTLRCTRKLLKRMGLTPDDLRGAETPEPTTALGDWYANLVHIHRMQLVMLVSDRARLLVLVPARDIDRLRIRFEVALMELLRDLDVPEEALVRKSRAMQSMGFGLTSGTADGRSVLGSMNDYTHALRNTELDDESLHAVNLHFSDWICGPLGFGRPRDAARRLLLTQPPPVSS